MYAISHPEFEIKRQQELYSLGILDTEGELEFNEIVHLASAICGVPIAAISIVDKNRQWFKSSMGLGVSETPREDAFCAHTILEDSWMIVEDALEDTRFSQNPLVQGPPYIRFYAGAKLLSPLGMPLGSLCVIDVVPRILSQGQLASLLLLSRQTSALIELHQKRRLLERQANFMEAMRYAYKLQQATLPSPASLQGVCRESFLLSRPVHLVGGDFGWVHRGKERTTIALGGSSGRGLEGAMVASLAEVVLSGLATRDRCPRPDLLLQELTEAWHSRGVIGKLSANMGLHLAVLALDEQSGMAVMASTGPSICLVKTDGTAIMIAGDGAAISGAETGSLTYSIRELSLASISYTYMLSNGALAALGHTATLQLEQTATLPFDLQQKSLYEAVIAGQFEVQQSADVTILGMRL